MSSPVRINLRDTGNTEFTPSPYRWIVPDSAALPKTVAVDDLHKLALITSTGVTLRLSNVSPAQWSPMTAKDLELTSRVGVTETNISSITGRVSAAETNISSVTGRVTASEKKINTAETKITAAEKKINTAETKINTAGTNISSVTGRVTASEKKINTAETKITAAETKINTATTNISSVTGKVTAAEKKITASETKIAAAETKINTATTNISSVTGKVTAAETKITAAETKIVSINNLKSLGYDLDVKTVTNGAINVNAGQVFKIPSSGSRSISISNATTTGRMRTIAIMIEGAGAVTWPVAVKWVGGTAPKLGASYTLVAIAVFEKRVVGQEVISV